MCVSRKKRKENAVPATTTAKSSSSSSKSSSSGERERGKGGSSAFQPAVARHSLKRLALSKVTEENGERTLSREHFFEVCSGGGGRKSWVEKKKKRGKKNAADSHVFLFYFSLEFARADEIVSTSAAGSRKLPREFSLEEEIRIWKSVFGGGGSDDSGGGSSSATTSAKKGEKRGEKLQLC